ncbi:MAG: alpha/beta hydrolase [Dehalococcoidia bacterium]
MHVIAHHIKIQDRLAFIQVVEPESPSGVDLLLLHTAGQSGAQWRRSLEPLSSLGYRLIVPDLPGHGHSEPCAVGPVQDISTYAAWTSRLIDMLQRGTLTLVGCSIGGKIAQDVAIARGDRVGSLVSMCAPIGPGSVNLEVLWQELEDSAAAARMDRTHLGTRAVIGNRVSKERAELIARMHCREDPLVSISDLIAWATHDAEREISAIACPATFVAATDDLWVEANELRDAANTVSPSRFVLLEGYGHYPMEEMPNFAKELHGWIADMEKEGRQ